MALSQPSPSSSSSSSHPHPPPQVSVDRLESAHPSSPALKDHTVVQSPPILVDAPSTSNILNDLSNRQVNTLKHHQSTLSTSSSKQNRGGFFTLAALARDKTSNAIASLSEPSIRSRPSSGSLYRSAQSSPTSPSNNSNSLRSADSQTSSQDNSSFPNSTVRNSLLETDPPSQAYANTASDTPAPIVLPRPENSNKMHQTSSRLLRMTSDDRPFTRVRKNHIRLHKSREV